MNRVVAALCADIRALVRDLAAGGGQIGPSVYDTAQVLRLQPAASGGRQVVDWLIEQQAPDGGWGDPAAPLTRDVPTLAAILAIHAHAAAPADRRVVIRGVDFLRGHAGVWAGPLPNGLPVGIEVLVPHLLQAARQAGLDVPVQPYSRLAVLGQRRLHALGTAPVGPGTPVAHSWEAFGDLADPRLLDDRGSVGNSPAATAAWLRTARHAGEATAQGEAAAGEYLRDAAAATGTAIPGLVPTVWPIERFEQSFALYALLIGGLLEHPALRHETSSQIDLLHLAMRPTGLGMSDEFSPDGDDTAAALAVLASAGRAADLGILERFADNGHFVSYVGELQPSVSVSAHAAHAFAVRDPSSTRGHARLIGDQRSDGRWSDDKWHGSWIYATSQVLVALLGTPSQHHPAVRRATRVLLAEQRADGGWGSDTDGATSSNSEETAFGVLGLRALVRHGRGDAETLAALQRGERWMQSAYRPADASDDRRWLGKESYRPRRIVRMFELAATFPSTEIPIRAEAAGRSRQARTRNLDAVGPPALFGSDG